ncbi:MAG: hypothetical protein ABJA85_07010 [Bacteroidota bacterium]
MTKILLLLYCLAGVAPATIFSQKTFISIGADLASPSSVAFKRNAGTGFGGSVRIASSWGKHILGMATFTYLSFAKSVPYSRIPTSTTKASAYTIQAGIKYYIISKKDIPRGFFFALETGIMPTATRFTYATNPDNNFKETGLSGAPGFGYQFGNLEPGIYLQYNLTNAGYNIYYFDFRLAYTFFRRKKE